MLLKKAQLQTNELYASISSTLLKFRMEMSDILVGIANESLSHIVKGLQSPRLADINSSEVDSESESIGKSISRCASQADIAIQAAAKQFFNVFNPIQNESLILLNTVLQQIVNWNSTSDPTAIVDRINQVLATKSDEFVGHVVPTLEGELTKFKSTLFLIPAGVSKCVNEAF